jgi:hypothetical protein
MLKGIKLILNIYLNPHCYILKAQTDVANMLKSKSLNTRFKLENDVIYAYISIVPRK